MFRMKLNGEQITGGGAEGEKVLGPNKLPLVLFTQPWGIHRCLVHFWPVLSFGVRLGFWFPNVRTIQPLGTHARMLAETALIADSLQLDTFVHSAWRTPVVLPRISLQSKGANISTSRQKKTTP